jgi:hypothetical protein
VNRLSAHGIATDPNYVSSTVERAIPALT